MRNSPTQLPSIEELNEILSKEAKREIPHSKEGVHFPNFSAIKKLLTSIEIDSRFFDQELLLSDLDKEILNDVSKMIDLFVERSSGIKKNVANEVYEYLSEEDALESADLLFVFGSKGCYRIDKAIDLWKKGYAPKIFISGNKPNYDKRSSNEAETLKKYAIQNGVTDENIITESNSITLPDNVKRSLNVLDQLSDFRKIILVNSPYSQRRGWCHFMKFSKDEYTFIRANADTRDILHKENWYQNDTGLKIYINEFIKMKVAVMLNSA